MLRFFPIVFLAVPVTLAMSPIQQLDQYQLQLEKNPRYSTIGRPGRGLHHHLHHNNSGIFDLTAL